MKIKITPILFLLLSVLVVLLFVRLWVGAGSFPEIWELDEQIARQTRLNEEQAERNKELEADVSGISRSGLTTIEDHARNELGMIKENETFYQIILREDESSEPVPVIPEGKPANHVE